MFYLSYLRSELVRRKGRTILTVLGLSVGVALVISISALSRGLDHAQKTALNPLSSIGTDLTVTLSPEQDTGGGGGFGGGGGGGGGNRQVVQANQSAITDLSKLGKPGTKFVHDFFLPGTQLTFPQSQTKDISAIDGVSAVSAGLVLSAVHQSGTVPKIVAKIKTGGQTLTVTGRVRIQQTPAERAKIAACFASLAAANSGSGSTTTTDHSDDDHAERRWESRRWKRRRWRAAGRRRARLRRPRRRVRSGRGGEVPSRRLPELPPQHRHAANRRSSSSSTRRRRTSRARAIRSPASTRRTPNIGLVTPSLLSSGKFISSRPRTRLSSPTRTPSEQAEASARRST